MNNICDFIKALERPNFPFKPDKAFYNKVNIGRKRWAQILRREVSPTIEELSNVAEYFKVPIQELIK